MLQQFLRGLKSATSINENNCGFLKQEIKGKNRSDVIDFLEESIAEKITKVTKEKQFFSLPLNNILNIVSKTDLSEQKDPI